MAQDAQFGSQRFLTLTLGEELFAIDIFSVREILDYTDITRIPQTPEYMRGVVNVRGNAVPVVDLRMKFGLGRVERTLNTRIVIVEIKKDPKSSDSLGVFQQRGKGPCFLSMAWPDTQPLAL